MQYEWSHRAKSREMLKHVHAALDSTSNGACLAAEGSAEDEQLEKLLVRLFVDYLIVFAECPMGGDVHARRDAPQRHNGRLE